MITVEELMTTELCTLRETDNVHQARVMMHEHKIRHILIVDENDLFIGLLTQRDLLAATVSTFAEVSDAERDELEAGIPLSEVLIRDVTVAEVGTSLLEAAEFLLNTKHGCLPIVSQGYLRGILTEADFVKLAVNLMEKLAAKEDAHLNA